MRRCAACWTAPSARDRAILLLFLDTGLRLSELAGLRLADLRPDGSLKVMGKGLTSGSCQSARLLARRWSATCVRLVRSERPDLSPAYRRRAGGSRYPA